MSEVKRPMEFWIKRGTYEGDAFSSVDSPATYSTILDAPLEKHDYFEFQKKSFEENDMALDAGYIHVIEHSAFKKLQAELDETRAEIKSWVEKANSLSDFWNEDRKQLQAELDEAKAELKNKDTVRLWNECEELKKQLADATQREINLRSDWLEAREQIAEYREALEAADYRQKHTCNIEYGNNTGVENCVKCKIIKTLNKWSGK